MNLISSRGHTEIPDRGGFTRFSHDRARARDVVVSFRTCFFALGLLLVATSAGATIFGTVRGTVKDVQGRPLAAAAVTLQSTTSQWSRSAHTDGAGVFSFVAVPIGSYTMQVRATGLAASVRSLVLRSGAVLEVPVVLPLATVSEEVQVTAATVAVDPRSSTTQTTVTRQAIAETPGADRANSLAMITDFVPGAYMVHDQLHVRGGHQVIG